MRHRIEWTLTVVGALALAAGVGAQESRQAEEQARQRIERQVQQGARIYGAALMTEQERSQYRQRLQSMETEQERKQFRNEHKKEMEKRARQQGMVIDDDGNVLSSDPLRDRDQDRDRLQPVEQTSRPAIAPAPRQGGGRGGG